MHQITLSIPDNDFHFFMKLIQKFNYKTTAENSFSLTKEQKEILDKRRKTAKPENYISWGEAKKSLKFKRK